MRRRRNVSQRPHALVLAALLLAVAGCGGQSESTEADEVTVFAASAPDGLRATLDAFQQQFGIRVRLTGSANFVEDLQKRLADGDPPDIALFPQPAFLAELARSGDLVPLAPEVVAAVEANFSEGTRQVGEVDGTQFGIFYAANAKSLLWYSPGQFAANGFAVPETWEELTALTERMKRTGTAPWCFGSRTRGGASGWPATDWIEDLVLHTAGVDVYDEWVSGEIPFDDPRIEAAFQLFEETIVSQTQTVGGASRILRTLWNDAGEPLLADPAGCYLSHNPSFWIGSLPPGTTIGPDGDLDVFPLPVLDSSIGSVGVVGGDTAAAFSGRQEVMALLGYLATPESAQPWAAKGGYVSPHRDFDLDLYIDPFDRRVAEILEAAPSLRFDGSDLMPVDVGEGTFRDGMQHFIRTRDFPSTVEIIESGYASRASS